MKNNGSTKILKANRKILPALGGIKKNYIRKGWCLKKVIQFLAKKINDVESSLKDDLKEKKILKQIENDLLVVSKYENEKKMSFYSKCWIIANNY